MIVLKKQEVQALLTVASKESWRTNINCIHLEPKNGLVVATDGHRLLRFDIYEIYEGSKDLEPFSIPLDWFKEAIKGKKKHDPIAVSPEDASSKITYPDWRKVEPMWASSKGKTGPNAIGVNPLYLMDIGKVAKYLDLQGKICRVSMTDNDSPIRFDIGDRAVYTLMPMRI